LGGRVQEGRWLGVDEESKGVRVYWPEMRTVTVEQNTYYNNSSTSHLEGEEDTHITEMNVDAENYQVIPPVPGHENAQINHPDESE